MLITIGMAKEKVIVFHAGNLSVPFAQMEKAFESKYPQYDLVREAVGSRACTRKITDIGKPADVMASAAYKVIDNLLTADNWPDIFLKKGVKVGHSNPNLDPCGYRSILVTKLAERYYHKPGFYEALLGYGDSYTNGEAIMCQNGQGVIALPTITGGASLLKAGDIESK